ncbi:MAG: curli production assembly/transport component CsgF [Candidatus Aureabacteria bacterium]|nr:curli production assembly/transport component CsgF [Candidatus Auribacterota bacterium]
MKENNDSTLFLKCLLITGLASVFFFQQGTASELVYTPKNPAFGGNPNNASWLLNEANAQNTYKEEIDPIEEFKQQLQRQIFYRLSQAMVTRVFGYNQELQDGEYIIGDYTIRVDSSGDSGGIDVEIISQDGSSTTIEIPGI